MPPNIGTPLPSARPFITNPDGSRSTERTMTTQAPNGRWANVPTIQGGAELPMDTVESLYNFGLVQDVGQFPAREIAEQAARDRSQALSGFYKQSTQPGTPPAAPQFRQIVDALMSQPMARPRLGTGSQPMWGFHEPTVTAGQGVDAALQAAPQVLSDPRNAWFGLGPIAGMARPIGKVGGWMRGWEPSRDLGGFKPPVGHIPDMKQMESRHTIAEGINSPDINTRAMYNQVMGPMLEDSNIPLSDRNIAQNIYDMSAGLRQLKAERDLMTYGGGANGGAIPPRSLMDDLKEKFGFGE